jgi:hypothetical protein
MRSQIETLTPDTAPLIPICLVTLLGSVAGVEGGILLCEIRSDKRAILVITFCQPDLPRTRRFHLFYGPFPAAFPTAFGTLILPFWTTFQALCALRSGRCVWS